MVQRLWTNKQWFASMAFLALGLAILATYFVSLAVAGENTPVDVYVVGSVQYVGLAIGAVWLSCRIRRGKGVVGGAIFLSIFTVMSMIGFVLAVALAGEYPGPVYMMAAHSAVVLSLLTSWVGIGTLLWDLGK
ncbi:MAG: hypothetical protein WD534_17570 [Phycisphaeraceae bacterium]